MNKNGVTPGKFVFAPASSPSCRAAGDVSIYGELAQGGGEYGARKIVATVPDTVYGSAGANAEFIVRACNCHADLIAALEHMLGACDPTVDREDDEHFDYAEAYIACDAARRAIARARGEA